MRLLLIAGIVCLAGVVHAAEPVKMADPKDLQVLQGFLQNVAKLPAAVSPEYCRKVAAEETESYSWVILPQLRMPLTAYRMTGDANHLDVFVRVFENMRTALTKGRDGDLDWHGKALPNYQDPNNKDKPVPVEVNTFRTAEVLCGFAEVVAADAELTKKYGGRSAEYVRFAEDLVAKWQAWGNFVDLGKGGAVYRTYSGLRAEKAHLTQPHNKQSIPVEALLALYRVTGKDEYMRKAIQVGTRFKHCLTLKDGHYEWNYWDPAGAWDVSTVERTKWKMWIGVEHTGSYYSLSLTHAVELYQHGVVFDRTDIERFLKTQLEKCWNGDTVNPKWARVDGSTSEQYMKGDYICPALAPYSEKVAAFLYTGPRLEDRLKNATSPWQGGPVLSGWLTGKWIDLPAAKADPQPYLAFGKKFLQKKENQEFARSLEFQVTGSGYAAPRSPVDMKPMPPEPRQ